MSKAVEDIVAERERQVKKEEFSPERDDNYKGYELPLAAAAYVSFAGTSPRMREWMREKASRPPIMWPSTWDVKWWKPSTPRRDLVKAAALIIAEIERIDRIVDRGVK
jgi:hypothetical protein